MAIIYTYPRLTNPDGTELIVVTETKNENATRLLTVADICEFCNDQSCENSFSTVTTSSTTPAQAIGCDQNLELTSSDGTVNITNAGNVVDFKAGCVKRYILKPILCDEPVEGEYTCEILEDDASTWFYTCDPQFADYLYDVTGEFIKVDGLTLPLGKIAADVRCVAVFEEPTYTITTGDCDFCCAPPPQYLLTNCSDPEDIIYVDDESASGPSGPVSNYNGTTITFESAEICKAQNCYTVSGPIEPVGALQIIDINNELGQYEDCPCCEYYYFQEYVECVSGEAYVICLSEFQLNDLKANGASSPYFTIRFQVLGEPAPVNCATWNGEACRTDTLGSNEWEFIDNGCENELCSGSYELVPCGEGENLYTTADESPSIPANAGDVVDIQVGDETSCYTVNGPGLYPPSTGSYNVYGNYGDEGEACNCCTNSVKEYVSCLDGTSYYIDLQDPNFDIPTDNTSPPPYLEVNYTAKSTPPCNVAICLQYLACTPDGTEPTTFPAASYTISSLIDCDEPQCQQWYQYRQCGEIAWTYTQNDLSAYASAPSDPPNVWKIDEGCYEVQEATPQCTNYSPTGSIDLTGAISQVDCDECLFGPYILLESCDGAYTEVVSGSQFVGGPPSVIDEIYDIVSPDVSFNDGCYAVKSLNTPGPRTSTDNFTSNTLVSAGLGGLTACDCCEQDLRTYTICPGAAGVTCDALAPTSLRIDVNDPTGMNGTVQNFIVAEEISSSIQCCYELNPEIPACDNPTGIYVSTVADCNDAACNII